MKFFLSRFFLIVFFLLMIFVPSVKAESLGGYTLDQIDAKTVLNKDSTMTVTETITGEFLGERHGLYRNIPRFYNSYWVVHKTMPIEVLSVTKDGKSEPYELINSGAYLTIKIGDPNLTFSGPFEYSIVYQVSKAMIYEKDGTVTWYWNVAEDQWDAPVLLVTSELILPDDSKQVRAKCWSGNYSEICEMSSGDKSVVSSSTLLMTMLVNFEPPAGFYFPSQGEVVANFLKDNWDWFFVLIPIIVFFILYKKWSKTGRDPKIESPIIAEYEPPDNLSPFELSALHYAGLKDQAVTATIIDLAVRGYLRIEDSERARDRLTGTKYRLIKLKEVDDKLRDFEKDLLQKIFKDKNEPFLSECRGKLTEARISMDKLVWKSLISKDYFPQDPANVMSWYLGFGGGAMVLAFTAGVIFIGVFERYFVAVGFALAAIELFVFGPLMSRRSVKGTKTLIKSKGFKLFLETAEKYRIQWQEKEGIFEKFLPYAVIFGVTKKWTQNFEGTLKTTPGWYVGSLSSNNFSDFSGNLNSFVQTSTSLSTPSSSGGGSSGGGGGGGGGGSW